MHTTQYRRFLREQPLIAPWINQHIGPYNMNPWQYPVQLSGFIDFALNNLAVKKPCHKKLFALAPKKLYPDPSTILETTYAVRYHLTGQPPGVAFAFPDRKPGSTVESTMGKVQAMYAAQYADSPEIDLHFDYVIVKETLFHSTSLRDPKVVDQDIYIHPFSVDAVFTRDMATQARKKMDSELKKKK